MIARRAVPVAALLAASTVAHAQSGEPKDTSPALRAAVAAYQAGDLVGAETSLRTLAPRDGDAAAWLGAILLERGASGEGLRLIQQAADAGSAEGAHRLALVFAYGEGGSPRDAAKAFQWFQRAAEKGHQRAQLNLGTLYLRGQGVPRDLIEARAWLEKAAAKGDPHALYALGRAMSESMGPVAADATRATDLYRQAAEKGHPLAALRLGLALGDGIGVKHDVAAAQRWLLHAQASGIPEAALALGDMAARTPRAEGWPPRTTISPSSGRAMPSRVLMKVVLPAPRKPPTMIYRIWCIKPSPKNLSGLPCKLHCTRVAVVCELVG